MPHFLQRNFETLITVPMMVKHFRKISVLGDAAGILCSTNPNKARGSGGCMKKEPVI